MRAVVQRVIRAAVSVDNTVTGSIGKGLMVLLGAGTGDTDEDLQYIVDKIVNLRIFADAGGKMNLSVLDISGGVLLISQFTLYGDARSGRRPGFTNAMEPVAANAMYLRTLDAVHRAGVAEVGAGVFGADMQIDMLADGPVTILLDSKKQF
jgi:D-aminoacyl-tRNA deacylase